MRAIKSGKHLIQSSSDSVPAKLTPTAEIWAYHISLRHVFFWGEMWLTVINQIFALNGSWDLSNVHQKCSIFHSRTTCLRYMIQYYLLLKFVISSRNALEQIKNKQMQ